MRRTRIVVASLAAALVASAVTLPGPAAARDSARDGDRIAWGPCANRDLFTEKAECGFVTVPMDWDRPNGPKIQLAVSRVRATVAKGARRGVMLTNPGGPGLSGVRLALLGGAVPRDVGDRYDWIGFDPRGVGESKPALSCDATYFDGRLPDYRPNNRLLPLGDEADWVARSTQYAATCGARHGDFLDHLKSVDTVRDMEAIRIALGERKIGFFGFGYGTLLGQLYATQFPNRVGPMVLDGNIAGDKFGYADRARAIAISVESGMAAFWRWTAERHNRYGLGNSAAEVQSRYNTIENALRITPVGTIGPTEWNDVFLLAAYSDGQWPILANALALWEEERPEPIRRLLLRVRNGGDNQYAAFLGQLCSDDVGPRNNEQIRQESFAIEQQAPFAVWNTRWATGPCTTWPAAQGQAPNINGDSAPPILLVNTTQDAITPFAGAIAVRTEFPRSALIAEVGSTSHATSLSGNRCVDNAIAAYLRSGRLPARKAGIGPDLVCDGTPVPR
ncbi:MAG: alpha/beta hydrolase [Sporichthyaceae bacterium]